MATPSITKQKTLARLLGLPKRQLEASEPESRPVLEQLLYAVCRENASRAQADRAFKNLQTTFFDWNEIRVSSAREVEEALEPLTDAEMRAARIIALLQEVFESTYAFDLESLHKKGLKQAQKQLERYQGSNPYIVASTLQIGLQGHALPLDDGMQRTLRRLELLDGELTDETVQASFEHLIPKAKGPIFCELVSGLTRQHCHEAAPACGTCPMHEACPAGQANTRRPAAAARATVKAWARLV